MILKINDHKLFFKFNLNKNIFKFKMDYKRRVTQKSKRCLSNILVKKQLQKGNNLSVQKSFKKQNIIIHKNFLKTKYNFNNLSKRPGNLSTRFCYKNMQKEISKSSRYLNKSSEKYISGFFGKNIYTVFKGLDNRNKVKKSLKKIKFLHKLGIFENYDKNKQRKLKKISFIIRKKNKQRYLKKNESFEKENKEEEKPEKKKSKKEQKKILEQMKILKKINSSEKNKIETFLKKKNQILKKNNSISKDINPIQKYNKIKINSELKKIIKKKFKNLNNNHPLETRANLTLFFIKKNIIIFGGIGERFFDNLIEYNIQKKKTRKIRHDFLKRKNHIAVKTKSFIIFQGGQSLINKNRILLNDTCVLDINNFSVFKLRYFPYELPKKKNHAGFLSDNILYILGGIDQFDELDCFLYSVNVLTCFTKREKIDNFSEKLSHFKCVLIGKKNSLGLFGKYNKKVVVSLPVVQKNKKNEDFEIQKEPKKIFIFGGLKNKSEATNLMRILTTGDEEKWIMNYPKIKGVPPKPRFNYNSLYLKKIKSVVICGGKTFCNSDKKEEIFGDLFLFHIEKYFYVKLDMRFNKRYCFGMDGDDKSFFIFGGFGEDNFTDGLIHGFELDKMKIDYWNSYFDKKN